VPFNVVPCRANGGNNSGERVAFVMAKNAGGIFCHNDAWPESRNNPEKLTPHPSSIVCTFLLSGQAHWLTRNASTNQVHFPCLVFIWWKRPNVSPPLNARPVLLQNAVGIVINLHLPSALHPGSLKPEREATNPCEQFTEGQHHSALFILDASSITSRGRR
jgi:hypothetical protein